jgi:hypothetical protein
MMRQLAVLLFAALACAVHIEETDLLAAGPARDLAKSAKVEQKAHAKVEQKAEAAQEVETEAFEYRRVLKKLNGLDQYASTPEGGVDTGVYEWTQAGIDTISAANKVEEFAKPQVGQKLTSSQTLFASDMGLKVKQMLEEHLVAFVGTQARRQVNTEALEAQGKLLEDAQKKDETLLQWTEKGTSMLKSYGYYEVFGTPKEGEVVSHRQMKLATAGSEFNMTQLLQNGMVAHNDATGDAIHNGGVVDTKQLYKWTEAGISTLNSGSWAELVGNPKVGDDVTELMIDKITLKGFPIEKLVTDKIIAVDVPTSMSGPSNNNVLLDRSNAVELHWTQQGVDMAKKNGIYDQMGHPEAKQVVAKEQMETAEKQGLKIDDLVAQGILSK